MSNSTIVSLPIFELELAWMPFEEIDGGSFSTWELFTEIGCGAKFGEGVREVAFFGQVGCVGFGGIDDRGLGWREIERAERSCRED